MASFEISGHAIARFIERVEPGMTVEQARDAIRGYSRAIEAALAMGCQSIRLGCGARLVVDQALREVITVLPRGKRMIGRKASGRRPDFAAIQKRERKSGR